jgi:hypothetical protein
MIRFANHDAESRDLLLKNVTAHKRSRSLHVSVDLLRKSTDLVGLTNLT